MATNPEKDFQADLDTLRGDIASLSDTVGKLAAEAAKAQAAMGKTMKKAAKNAAGDVEEMWDEAVTLGRDTASAAKSAAYAAESTVEAQIKQNPIGAVLVALGIGFVVGILGRK